MAYEVTTLPQFTYLCLTNRFSRISSRQVGLEGALCGFNRVYEGPTVSNVGNNTGPDNRLAHVLLCSNQGASARALMSPYLSCR